MNSVSILQAEECIQTALEALPAMSLNNDFSDALRFLAPEGYRVVVELQEDGRKKRRTASVDNWTPETGEILISFSRDSSPSADTRQARAESERIQSSLNQHSSAASYAPKPAQSSHRSEPGGSAKSTNVPDNAERELCEALEEAERQGRAFIALKWFRDEFLVSKGFNWADDPNRRQEILSKAIENGLILTSRIPNPRSPFPTSTIRLNRSRRPDSAGERRFSPIRIKGEPLSSTILRDRGVR